MLLPAVASAAELSGGTEEPVVFAREILPLLQQHCQRCHGGVHREAGLSFVSPEAAMSELPSGARALVPGRPDSSALWQRVTSPDADLRMPPDGALSAQEIDLLTRWIEQGAVWERHWAFVPVGVASPEPVESLWARDALDLFVLAKLDEAKLSPSPAADRETLIRRLYLDLLGLPPRLEDIEQYCADERPGAYERLVDRVLSSPHFGERWGRHWLDQARYADTDGFEVDGPRPTAWRWRDWVIEAFNSDLPFDQFTQAQLAGDLQPDAAMWQRLATSFHRQSLTNREGGIDQQEARYKELVDRLNAAATIFMGLTLSCAQCHDHPYDPFTQQQYFQLYAFFEQTTDSGLDVRQSTGEAANADDAVPVVVESPDAVTTRVYHRGDFLRPADAVRADVLRQLLTPRGETASGMSRSHFADWLTDPGHPLVTRVAVNQLWLRLFGQGLVRTPEDWGSQGELPTHPQLLDHLAREFVAQGWSQKALIRRIVLSAAYRQTSQHRPDAHAIDPENRLWHRQNRTRVEAEIVRDLHLATAGLLEYQIGGPSIYPPLADGVAKLSFRSNYVWPTSQGADRYRRGLYIFFKRTLPYPNLDAFDCPDASAARMQRDVSTTPLQALTAWNNEVHAEAAREFAMRVLRGADSDPAARLEYAYRLALGRVPSRDEVERLIELLATCRDWYAQHPAAARTLAGDQPSGSCGETAAWIVTLGTVLQLDEFLTRE